MLGRQNLLNTPLCELLNGVRKHGKRFESLEAYEALRSARAYANIQEENLGLVVPLPLLMADYRDTNRTTFSTGSEEHYGKGEFKGHFGRWVVTLHSGIDGHGLFTPSHLHEADRLKKEYASLHDRVYTSVRTLKLQKLWGEDVFQNLLNGVMPDGSEIPLIPYEEILEGEANLHLRFLRRFGIVRQYDQAQLTTAGEVPLSTLIDAEQNVIDSQLIAHAGSVELATAFRKQLPQDAFFSYALSNVWSHTDFNLSVPQGYMLALYPDGRITGSYESAGPQGAGQPPGRFLALNKTDVRNYHPALFK